MSKAKKDVAKMTPEEADKATVEAINKVSKTSTRTSRRSAARAREPAALAQECAPASASASSSSATRRRPARSRSTRSKPCPEPQDDGAQQRVGADQRLRHRKDAYYQSKNWDGGVHDQPESDTVMDDIEAMMIATGWGEAPALRAR